MEKLKITGAEIIFANLKDEGFGTSLTIKVTQEIEKLLVDFWAANKIGNEKTVIGVPTFKEYEGTKQFSVKINDQTKFAYVNGLDQSSLGYGSVVNFFINAFEYNNEFTKGKTYFGASVSAVVVVSGRKTGADADLNELLGESINAQQEQVTKTEVESVQELEGDLPF